MREDAIRRGLRESSFASFALFATSSGCTSAFHLVKGERWLRAAAVARYGFAASHAAHLALIVTLLRSQKGGPHPIKPISYVGGVPGYLTIAAMLVRGPRRAPRLHRLGEWFLLVLFAIAFSHGYSTKGRDARLYAPLAAACAAVVVLLQLSDRARHGYERDQSTRSV